MDRTSKPQQGEQSLPFILRYAERALEGIVSLPGDPLLGRDTTTVYATTASQVDTTSDDD